MIPDHLDGDDRQVPVLQAVDQPDQRGDQVGPPGNQGDTLLVLHPDLVELWNG